MHDLGAELQGYRDELATVADPSRVKAVRAEISRVRQAVTERADALDAQAKTHDEAGQDVPAAETRVEARRYRAMLQDAAESKPQETAVPRRAGSRRGA